MSNLRIASAKSLSKAIQDEKLSCLELLEYNAKQISLLQSKINAFTSFDIDSSRKIAASKDKSYKKERLGDLWGLTFSAKDNICVSGFSRSEGNKQTLVASESSNSALVSALLSAGAYCVGKGNMAEYGKSFITDNLHYGATRNPFNWGHSAGGSSGGDAAAVAADFCFFGLAADAGGSVRIPANFCGLFGLYPTRGLFSGSGCHPLALGTSSLFKSHGVITRSLDDIEVLLNVLAAFDPIDPNSATSPSLQSPNKSSKRFIYFDSMNGVRADDEISQALADCITSLNSLGYTGERLTPKCFEASPEVYILLGVQCSLLAEDLLAARSGTPRDTSLEGESLKLLRHRLAKEFPALSTERVILALHSLESLRSTAASLFTEFDFIVSPVLPILPPQIGATSLSANGIILKSEQVVQFASAANVLGLPSIAFPTNLSQTGLPVGLQIMGPRFSEHALIGILRLLNCQERLVSAII